MGRKQRKNFVVKPCIHSAWRASSYKKRRDLRMWIFRQKVAHLKPQCRKILAHEAKFVAKRAKGAIRAFGGAKRHVDIDVQGRSYGLNLCHKI